MEHLKNHEVQHRPWGQFERFTLNECTTVKIISVNPGQSISLQTHANRDEFWRVLTGTGTIRIGETDLPAREGNSFFCPRGAKHRVIGGPEGIVFLEIAFGEFSEDDIRRLEDIYGRK